MLVVVKDYETFEVLGQTRDDAAGEAFDKLLVSWVIPIREALRLNG